MPALHFIHAQRVCGFWIISRTHSGGFHIFTLCHIVDFVKLWWILWILTFRHHLIVDLIDLKDFENFTCVGIKYVIFYTTYFIPTEVKQDISRHRITYFIATDKIVYRYSSSTTLSNVLI